MIGTARRARPLDLEQEFDHGASRYDLMVSLNRGYHQHLRRAADLLAASLPRHGRRTVLDLGCGSGASTVALLDAVAATARDGSFRLQAVGVDASDGMLAQARAKTVLDGVRFVHADARAAVTAMIDDGTEVDAALACYLFRNVPDADATLEALYDLLPPGGCLVVQDYALTRSRSSRLIWTLLCWTVIIPLSVVLSGHTSLYRYLWHSVLRFDTAPRFAQRLRDAGFVPVVVHRVPGWQRPLLHVFVAHRAVDDERA